MPGAGTFLHRFDQSERAIVFLIFTPGALAFHELGTRLGRLIFFLWQVQQRTPCPVCVRGVNPDRVNYMDTQGDV